MYVYICIHTYICVYISMHNWKTSNRTGMRRTPLVISSFYFCETNLLEIQNTQTAKFRTLVMEEEWRE